MEHRLTHGSLFSGIGGFDRGFELAGFRTLWAVEKEPFCQAVVRTRFPRTELFNDVRDCGKHNLGPVDVISAGFPCQDLSVAGKRRGLAGTRSGLFWELVRILGDLRPSWFLVENVPGLFSSNEGRDFGVVLHSLDELGYGLAWRVLDSQHFGVAQRRRRVFIAGRLGKPCPPEVLFESEGGPGDSAEGGETWTDIAAPLTSGIGVTGNAPRRHREDDFNLAITGPLGGGAYGTGRRDEDDPNLAYSVTHLGGNDWRENTSQSISSRDWRSVKEGDPLILASASADSDGMRAAASLPPGLDSARYRALGNAVTVSVAEWIARRIKAVLEERDEL